MRQRSLPHVVATIVVVAVAAACGASDGDTGSATADVASPATTGPTDIVDEPAGHEAEASASTEPETSPTSTTDEAPAPGVIEVSLTAEERSAADDPVAQAIIAAFPAGFTPPSDEQANCVGGKIVTELGTDRLAELGITADSVDVFGASDFTVGEVDAMVDILFECVDVENLVASMFAPSAGPETADCFADFVDESLIRDLAAPFLGGGAIDAELFLERVQAANAACLPVDS